jgi:hypothetical protein
MLHVMRMSFIRGVRSFSMINRIALAALALSFAVGACDDSSPSSPSNPSSLSTPEPQFQNESRQTGLVNVSTGNVELLNNVNLAVAAQVLATVCDLTIPIAVLAEQVVVDGPFSPTECVTTSTPDGITIEQSGGGPPNGPLVGGNSSQQEGLINVSVGDVAILNDLNAAVAANVLVTVCDVTVAAAILAVQGVGDTSDTVCETSAGPIEIVQSQG